MNLHNAIRESLRDLTKEPTNQETKPTLGDIMREALEKKGVEMTEEEKDELTKVVEYKLEETHSFQTSQGIYKKSLREITD